NGAFTQYAADADTYIRKNAYLALGLAYRGYADLQASILELLRSLFYDPNPFIRQTVVYTLGEIGRLDADSITEMLEEALNDEGRPVRSAVVGALKRIGEKDPDAAITFARKFLFHPNPTVRKEIIHGIELRGRTHPEDVLPLLQDAQHDPDAKVRKMVIHVLAQVSYKEGCLETVLATLRTWDNVPLVQKALEEIVAVHGRYAKFSALTPQDAEQYIRDNFPDIFS
ncbi:MAG TPA: HEAT repeat domain-containing protein, partial [Candidatus Lokiarchaeia archaeon]|nr:HEAT repeat domain-containing protein [Candidatus Lokiarchaeia archaeon]